MSKIRDKDIQFLLDIEIPSDSEVSFCGRDDDMEHQDAIIIGPKEEDQILKEMKEMEDFQRNTMTELEKVDECIAINDEVIHRYRRFIDKSAKYHVAKSRSI